MKNHLKKPTFLPLFGLFLGMSLFSGRLHGQLNGEIKPGAIIVLSAKGLVQAVDPAGNAVSSAIKSGAILTEGYTLKTGFGGEATVLFSNGTTATLEPRTQISIITFLQESFNGGNQKLADLSEEPSTSQLVVKIHSGAVICKTKKLNQSSSFTIVSDAGTAKIMGTEFQLGLSIAGQTKLDVATSTVSFSPPGGTPILVSQGKGLDVSSSGQVNQRPISPAISANISTKNAFASNIANQIPLATVNLAKSKAIDLASANGVAASSRSFNGNNEDNEKDEDSEAESDSSEPSTEAAESFLSQQGTDIRSIPGAQTTSSYRKMIQDLANGTLQMASIVKVQEFELVMENDILKLKFPYADSENDDGPTNKYHESKTLSLSGVSLDDIYGHLQSHLDSPDYDNKLLASALYVFMDMPSETNWDNENEALKEALRISNIFLTNVTLSGSNSLELSKDLSKLSKYTISQAPVLKASDLVVAYEDNPYLYEVGMIMAKYGAFGDQGRTTNEGNSVTDIAIEILKFAGGRGKFKNNIPESISLGDESNSVLINAALFGSEHNDLIEKATPNPAEGESDSLSKKEQADALYKIYLDNIYGVVGADVTLGDNSNTEIDVSNILTKAERLEKGEMVEDGREKKIMAFAAANDLHLKGQLTFKNENTAEDHILVLGAADHIETTELKSIKYEGSNLGIGSYSSLTLNKVDIEVGGNLAIGSLSDIDISASTFSVGKYSDRDNVYIFAEKELNVDGLKFEARPDPLNERAHAGVAREIYMEAITIDLKNVHFPAESEVMLRSRDGMPIFYGYHGTDREIGAVNFYQDTNTYNETAITSATFTTSPNANPNSNREFMGYDSVGNEFKTSTGEPGIKIRKFPD